MTVVSKLGWPMYPQHHTATCRMSQQERHSQCVQAGKHNDKTPMLHNVQAEGQENDVAGLPSALRPAPKTPRNVLGRPSARPIRGEPKTPKKRLIKMPMRKPLSTRNNQAQV